MDLISRTNVGDTISRQAAIEALYDWEMCYTWDEHCREEDPKPAYIISPSDVIEKLPSAEPDLNEWCTDCKEYDQERHCCPRFNRVIRETLDEVKEQQQYQKKGKWILDKFGQFRCSNCERVPVNQMIINATLVYDIPAIKEYMKYCPMCGARME